MATYYVTSLGGLEEFVRREIAQRLPGAALHPQEPDDKWGRTYFDYDGPATDTLALRSVHNVFAALGRFGDVPPDEQALDIIRERLREADISPALELHAAIHGPRPEPLFRCTSKRLGEHTFGSMDIMAAAGAGVIDQRGWRVDLEGFDYDIHVDLHGEHLTIGLLLSHGGLNNRSRVVHVPASLNPALAYALCMLTDPQPGEVFIDATCGAGTVPIERAALGPATLLAGDVFRHPTQMAQRNFRESGVDVGLCQWDARRLPLAPGSVDKICVNLPWGRRAGSHEVNKHLYRRMIREFARVLRIDGLAVLLTLEKQMVTRCIAGHGWLRTTEVHPVSVGGLKPSIYVVRKWREHERPEEE